VHAPAIAADQATEVAQVVDVLKWQHGCR